MTKKQKAKWIKALRSGYYKQGKEALCLIPSVNDRQYCCLGVAQKVLGLKTSTTKLGMVSCSFLPSIIQDKLVRMNDVDSRSFAYIATYISKHVKPTR